MAQHDPTSPVRPARSKNGCLTCRRRKVRCGEQRPRCSHCERLNLECKWRPPYAPTTQWRFVFGGPGLSSADGTNAPAPRQSPHNFPGEDSSSVPDGQAWLQNPEAIDQVFDYASLMWDAGGVIGQVSPEQSGQSTLGRDSSWSNSWVANLANTSTTPNVAPSPLSAAIESKQKNPHPPQASPHTPEASSNSGLGGANMQASPRQIAEDHDLISYFIGSVVPPILAEAETQKRWSSMRQMLISMSNSSSLVRYAILAFSSLLYCRQEAPWLLYSKHHYDAALSELMAMEDVSTADANTNTRQNVLATLFFLCYVDILQDCVDSAHAHLKRAYCIFQQCKQRGFRPVEMRLLSWIRLLDARAVSAGGEGLFLSHNSDVLIASPSPAAGHDTDVMTDGNSLDEVKDWDMEDVLFQVLYHPGIIFFQKCQSFMGRITMIDPWHRSRGTVEDEMEVMQIASQILKDLRALYDERPTLMDHAVEGNLTAPYVLPNLATAITRAFRTYLCNYHASKIHLHRVAFKHLPLTRETTKAMSEISRLTKLLVDSSEPDTALPVSQLWPLLMWGSEEGDPLERDWIKDKILQMEKVATNARITAHVLQEVQARQDASKSRVDIRFVMHDIFDSCFAIM